MTFALLAAVVLALLRLPVTGLQLAPAGQQLLVVARHQHAPAVPVGSRLQLDDAPLAAEDLLAHQHDSFADWRRADAARAALDRLHHSAAAGWPAQVDGLPSRLHTRARQLEELPVGLWLHLGVGAMFMLVPLTVLSLRPRDAVARHFALLGLGILVSITSDAVFRYRELAFPAAWLAWLGPLNHAGNLLAGAALLALMACYPTPLHRAPMLVRLSYTSAALLWLGLQVRVFDGPDRGVPMVLSYLLASIVPGVLQWRRTARRPVERAALRWFVLTFGLSLAMVALLLLVPVLLGLSAPPPLLVNLGLIALLVVPLGMALGITRYRLFELDRWWSSVWTWFFGGVAVMLLDAALIAVLGLSQWQAMPLALALLGWLYFPLRQWVWQRWFGGSTPSSGWPRALYAATDGATLTQQWIDALRDRFRPLDIALLPAPVPHARLGEHGVQLDLPGLEPDAPGLRLRHAHSGARLFSGADIQAATAMLSIARALHAALHERDRAVASERSRIRRDLHDDLGAKLLTLLYQVDAPQQSLVRSAIRDTQDILTTLDAHALPLTEAVALWRDEAGLRADTHGFMLHWQSDALDSTALLSARQHTDLARILREAITNAVRHAQARVIAVTLRTPGDGWLHLSVRDQAHQPSATQPSDGSGAGTRQIARRASDLGGRACWHTMPDGTQLDVCVPLTTPVQG